VERHRDGRWEWTAAPGVVPAARYQHAATFVGSRLHVSGGGGGVGVTGNVLPPFVVEASPDAVAPTLVVLNRFGPVATQLPASFDSEPSIRASSFGSSFGSFSSAISSFEPPDAPPPVQYPTSHLPTAAATANMVDDSLSLAVLDTAADAAGAADWMAFSQAASGSTAQPVEVASKAAAATAGRRSRHAAASVGPLVGRCKLPVSEPVFKAPMVSALETTRKI